MTTQIGKKHLKMEKTKAEYFLSSLTKCLQQLCHDYYESFGFETFAVVSGQLYLTVDDGSDVGFIVNEKVYKTEKHLIKYLSKSDYLKSNLIQSDKEGIPKSSEGYNSLEESPKDQPNKKGLLRKMKPKRATKRSSRSFESTAFTNPEIQQILHHSKNEFINASNTKPRRKYKPKVYTHMHDCLLCGRHFETVPRIATHMKSHIAERPFTCESCGKSFPTIMRLKSHRAMHIEDKPYSCDMCNYSCKQSQTLVLHKRTHTGEKPFACDICGTSFSQISSLAYHKTTHLEKREFLCDICQKCFKNVRNLKRHKRLHSNEKNFKCDVCGKLFLLKRYLQKHTRHHSSDKHARSQSRANEKQFICDICGDMFSSRDFLMSHQSRHTDENLLNRDNLNMLMMSMQNMYPNQRYDVYDHNQTFHY